MLSVGQILDCRYEILAPLAEGGMGAVYRARRILLGDDVAVVLATAWDSESDAEEFASAMTSWIEASGRPATVLPAEGSTVRVLFGSDADTLALLETAAA